jgi:transposase InsO family protein
MAWKERHHVSVRQEFVKLAFAEGACMSTLCERFRISRKTGYKWLARYRADGLDGLADRSRRPIHFRRPTAPEVEALVLDARDQHPVWGGRKLHHWLDRQGVANVPVPSTITSILRRNNRLDHSESTSTRSKRDWVRFEHPRPNDLWQMDFKGEFTLIDGPTCFPLTIVDDHSRYALAIRACGDQQQTTVQNHLIDVFRRYGLPQRMLMDNGSPWGDPKSPGAYTQLTVWLLRLGVRVWHGHPYHPQTQGKDERFHRTLKLEVLSRGPLENMEHSQRRFDRWREPYNNERPHESLGMDVPANRYQVSPRSFPEILPPVEYAADVVVRKVNPVGQFSFQGRTWKISQAFRGLPIGLRATQEDGQWDVYFLCEPIGHINIHDPQARSNTLVDVRPRPPIGEAQTNDPRGTSMVACGRAGVTHVSERL